MILHGEILNVTSGFDIEVFDFLQKICKFHKNIVLDDENINKKNYH
jgi:hypothetical protein